MSKAKKITYWIATLWLALGMVSTGIVQLLQIKEETEFIIQLGYPSYLLPFLGIAKFIGVVVILLPKFKIMKEWAYAGFFFMMLGALYSHLATHAPINEVLPPGLLLVLTALSWYFRPEERKAQFALNA